MVSKKSAAEPSYFGPRSVVWRVHSNPITLLGGLRALLIQALHPLAMAGVVDHSDMASDVFGRFRRTSDYLVVAIFGDRAAADAMGARVRAIHRHVHGVDRETGWPYRADDPELLLWVHCVLVDSFLAAQQRYGTPLSGAECNRYVAEMVSLAELVGLHRDEVPAGRAALRGCLASYRPVLRLTPGAKAAWNLLEHPPMRLVGRPIWALVFAAALDLMPKGMLAIYKKRGPIVPGSVLSALAIAGTRMARLTGEPPPVLAEALERAAREGVDLYP